MRTTVTLDDDTEQLVRERMRDKGIGFKQALNDAIRAHASGRAEPGYEPETFPMGALVDLTKAGQIAAELENREIIDKMRRDQFR